MNTLLSNSFSPIVLLSVGDPCLNHLLQWWLQDGPLLIASFLLHLLAVLWRRSFYPFSGVVLWTHEFPLPQCKESIIVHYCLKKMLKFSQSLVGVSTSQLLCPFKVSPSVFECILAFWHKKKYSRLTLYFSYARPGLKHFSKESRSLLVFRNKI